MKLHLEVFEYDKFCHEIWYSVKKHTCIILTNAFVVKTALTQLWPFDAQRAAVGHRRQNADGCTIITRRRYITYFVK